MTTTWHHHRSSWVLAPKAPTHPHRNLHSPHQNRVTGFYIWKRRTEKFSSIVEELRAGILEGAQGIKHPKHMETPKGPEHLLPPRLQKSHPWLHCFSQTQNTQKQWPRSDTQGSASPAKLNAGPIHSSQEQQESHALTPGPPDTPLHMGQLHTGVTQAWFHGCIQYCL